MLIIGLVNFSTYFISDATFFTIVYFKICVRKANFSQLYILTFASPALYAKFVNTAEKQTNKHLSIFFEFKNCKEMKL